MENKVMEPTEENIKLASEVLKNGGVIVCPTDCNVGLAVDPQHHEAIDKVYYIKKRPATKPLTLFIEKPEDWEQYGEVSEENRTILEKIIDAFWPGPLNIIVHKKPTVSDKMVCYGNSVSISCMGHPVLQRLLNVYGKPIAMTSANISGQADDRLVDIDTAIEQVGKDVDFILKGESQGTTKSSTIIDLTEKPKIVRKGDITIDGLNQAVSCFSEAEN